MKLIIVIISLLAERYIDNWQHYRQMSWLNGYFALMDRQCARYGFGQGMTGVVLMLLPPAVMVILIYWILGSLLSLLGFAFAVLVLIACIGPVKLDAQVKEYMHARKSGDDQGALYHAREISGLRQLSEIGQLTPAVIQGIFNEATSRYFSVFFWFVLLGPLGAVLVRVLAAIEAWSAPHGGHEDEPASSFHLACRRLRQWANWPVARIVAFGFGVTGSFVDLWHNLKDLIMADNSALLSRCGFSAIQLDVIEDEQGVPILAEAAKDLDEEVQQIGRAWGLVKRTLTFTLALLALLTLYGQLI